MSWSGSRGWHRIFGAWGTTLATPPAVSAVSERRSCLCHLQRTACPKGGLSWLFTNFPCFLQEVKYVSLPVPLMWIKWWMWLSTRDLSCEMSLYQNECFIPITWLFLQNTKGKTSIKPARSHLPRHRRVRAGAATGCIIPENLEPLRLLPRLRVCHCCLHLVPGLKLRKREE